MANPQKEDGFVAIANDLFEAIYMYHDFTKRQLKVLSSIIRHTYGWNKKTCTLSLREISAETGINFRHISTALQELIEKSVLYVEGYSNEKRTYRINKNYDEWGVTKTVTGVSPKRGHLCHQNGDTSVTKTVTHTIKRQLNTEKDKHSPDFLTLWELYPAERRDGLEWISAECEAEILQNVDRFREALESYLNQTPVQYLVKAEKFFKEKWKAFAPEDEPNMKRGNYQ